MESKNTITQCSLENTKWKFKLDEEFCIQDKEKDEENKQVLDEIEKKIRQVQLRYLSGEFGPVPEEERKKGLEKLQNSNSCTLH